MSSADKLVLLQIITFLIGSGMFWWGLVMLRVDKSRTISTYILAMAGGLATIISAASTLP